MNQLQRNNGQKADAEHLFNKLKEGRSFALIAWPSVSLAHVLADFLDYQSSRGRTSAIVSETREGCERTADLLGCCRYRDGVFRPRSMTRLDLINKLASREADDASWCERLGLVLVPRVEDTLGVPLEWEHLCYRLRDRLANRAGAPPQLVVLVSPRGHAEPALRRNLPMFGLNARYRNEGHQSHEEFFRVPATERVWWALWAAEGNYLGKIKPEASGHDCGAELVLAYCAGSRGVSPSQYGTLDSGPLEDELEALQREIGGAWRGLMQGMTGYFHRAGSCGAEMTGDASSNPWRTLARLTALGGKSLLAGVVLPRSLLRGYLVANGAYFRRVPFEPLTPRLLDSRRSIALRQYLRLQAGTRLGWDEVASELVRSGLDQPDRGTGNVFRQLREEWRYLFGDVVANRLKLRVSRRWQDSAHANDARAGFERNFELNLNTDEGKARVPSLEYVTVIAEGNVAAPRVRRAHVDQLYPEGHQCIVAGKQFRVVGKGADIVQIRKDGGPEVVTRSKLHVVLAPCDESCRVVEREDPQQVNGRRFQCEIKEMPAIVTSEGRWESADGGCNWAWYPAATPTKRCHDSARVLRLSLDNVATGGPLLTPAQRGALVAWLNEAAVTLLPESHRFFIAATQQEGAARCEQASPESPHPASATSLSFSDDQAAAGDQCAIWLVEDSPIDLGIVGAWKDRINWVLALCLDYLLWRLEIEEDTAETSQHCPATACLSQDFLEYGRGPMDTSWQDFAGLRQVLESSGFISRHTLTDRRLEALRVHGSRGRDSGFAGYEDSGLCDFCGSELTTQGERLPDGRERCTACADGAIDSTEQARQLFDQVMRDFPRAFGQEIGVAVEARFTSPDKIALAAGEQFLPTRAFDPRAIGLACLTANGEHKLYVENGHKLEPLAMTIAHELTHIWQYQSLDHRRMAEEFGNMLAEGHASWAELRFAAYMASKAESAEESANWEKTGAERLQSLMQRDDAYGNGYRYVVGNVGPDGNAFSWLQREYGKP